MKEIQEKRQKLKEKHPNANWKGEERNFLTPFQKKENKDSQEETDDSN